MSNEHAELLREVFGRVAEELAFMFVDQSMDDMPVDDPEGPCVLAEMSYIGPVSGKLGIAVPEELCPVITTNVLGLDEDDEIALAQPYDALKELLNVTCGNLLTEMAGDEPVFDLTVPEVMSLDLETWLKLKESPSCITVLLEDQPVLLWLR